MDAQKFSFCLQILLKWEIFSPKFSYLLNEIFRRLKFSGRKLFFAPLSPQRSCLL